MNTFEVRSFLSNILIDLLTNEKPDERQIMTYVSCYYHAFQGAMQVELRVPRHVTSPDDGKTCLSVVVTHTGVLCFCLLRPR